MFSDVDWLYLELNEFSVITIILVEWVPVLLTIIVGGLFATILFPRLQDRYLEKKLGEERRQKILEEVAELLRVYTTAWRRLIEISSHELTLTKEGRDTSHLQKYKARIVQQRTDTHDKLMSCLAKANLVLPKEQRAEISQFVDWAESTSTLTLDELPNVEEWRNWEERVVSSLRL